MVNVAIQGYKGSYTEEAVGLLFLNEAKIVECESFEATFDKLEHGSAEYVLVPVHNKIVGDIDVPKALIERGNYKVLDEITIKIKHVLAGVKGAEVTDLTAIYSQIEALKQCTRFLNSLPSINQLAASDTAESIRRVTNNGLINEAAIGSKRAAELYDAEILLENIADDRENWTTFNLLSK